MPFITDMEKDQPLKVGDYAISLVATDPGDHPTVDLRSEGPDGETVVTIDRATWFRPERADTAPNSPQYRVDPDLIHVGVLREGNIGKRSVEIAIEAPSRVKISRSDC